MSNNDLEQMLVGFQNDFNELFEKANIIKQSRIIEQNNLEHIEKELESLKEEAKRYNCDFDNIEETINGNVQEIEKQLARAKEIMSGNTQQTQVDNIDIDDIEI